jgi:hypothetical protein
MSVKRRGRPQSSDSKAAVKKRLQRAKKKGRSVTLPAITIKDADTWFAILKEEDADLVPEWAGKMDVRVIARATEAFLEAYCKEYRIDKAQEELDAACTRRTGQLEQEQPPGLKDKGIRFPTPPEHGDYVPNQFVGVYSKHEPLWNSPTKRDRGRHLSREEIEALGYTLSADNDEEDGAEEDVAHVDDNTPNDGSDEGFDDAESFMGDGDESEAYAGFEDEATED